MSNKGQMRDIVETLCFSSSNISPKVEECKSQLRNLLQTPCIFQKLNYDDGIIGIGCGILLLFNDGILDNDFMPLIYELDSIAMKIVDKRLLTGTSLGNGICGVGYYLYLRCKNLNIQDCDNLKELTIAQYIIFFIDWLSESVKSERVCLLTAHHVFYLIERLLHIGLLKDELHDLKRYIYPYKRRVVLKLNRKNIDPYPR
ncbi:hypothetical protein [Porphyromonas pogonae]